MTETYVIRPLAAADRSAWEPLWQGYQAFYRVSIPAETTEVTWQRLTDGAAPMNALGAFVGTELVGIVHVIAHPSCWFREPVWYLQDLYVLPDHRGHGIGRALIEAVYARADAAGAARVYWLTHESNTTAMALYDQVAARSGFVQYRRDRPG